MGRAQAHVVTGRREGESAKPQSLSAGAICRCPEKLSLGIGRNRRTNSIMRRKMELVIPKRKILDRESVRCTVLDRFGSSIIVRSVRRLARKPAARLVCR